MMKWCLGLVGATVAVALGASATMAADLPQLEVKGVGLNSQTIVSFRDEVPFWNDVIPKASGGKITATFSPMDVMGVKGHQMMRMSKLGVVDFASSDVSKMAGDDPVFEGCDLAGLALDIETARKACEAWLPVMSKVAEKKFGVKMLALGTNPPQVVWCRVPIKGLADLKGKKVRVFNKTMTDFIQAVGGNTISMPFAEVVPALQRGVVDCAVTGSLSGNTAGWPEVSTHQFKIILGWSINYQSVNIKSWKRFGPAAQKFFVEQFAKFEDKMWETGKMATDDADDCNFGYGKCDLGKMAKKPLTEVKVSKADSALHKQLMQDVVLVQWGKRAGKAHAKSWNETVGKVVGLSIPLDKL
ncbi:MAG: TRAP transporter substrate-binding protein [Rhodospirillales bacterium]|nr:TRAP transporter substrate-binding protein [Rhodospirillales bacterium]